MTLDTPYWNSHDETRRIHLLAHEFTHMPQQNLLTMPVFLARYALEYGRADNYVVPADLAAKPLSDLEPTFGDSNYTLDQIAERVADEAVKVAKAKGYI